MNDILQFINLPTGGIMGPMLGLDISFRQRAYVFEGYFIISRKCYKPKFICILYCKQTCKG